MLQNAYLMPKIIKYRGLGQDFHRGKTTSMEGLLYFSLKHLALANISNQRLD